MSVNKARNRPRPRVTVPPPPDSQQSRLSTGPTGYSSAGKQTVLLDSKIAEIRELCRSIPELESQVEEAKRSVELRENQLQEINGQVEQSTRETARLCETQKRLRAAHEAALRQVEELSKKLGHATAVRKSVTELV